MIITSAAFSTNGVVSVFACVIPFLKHWSRLPHVPPEMPALPDRDRPQTTVLPVPGGAASMASPPPSAKAENAAPGRVMARRTSAATAAAKAPAEAEGRPAVETAAILTLIRIDKTLQSSMAGGLRRPQWAAGPIFGRETTQKVPAGSSRDRRS